MIDTYQIFRDLSTELSPKAADVLANTLAQVVREVSNTVTRDDFRELKEVVGQLAEAQKRTEARLEDLAEAQQRTEARLEDLAEAQKRTEARLDSLAVKVGELAEAQMRTEARLEKLAEAQQRTVDDLRGLRREFGGFQKSLSYAFENEAYRMLPAILESRLGFKIEERILRKQLGDTEINFLARGQLAGEPAVLVGESKLRVQPNDVADLTLQIQAQSAIACEHYGIAKDVPVLVTHFAHPRAIEALAAKGIHVIQSFEWV